MKGKDAEAVGELVEDGFVVARIEVVPFVQDTVPSMRKKLVEGGVLVQEDGHLRFTQDYLFNTPSGCHSGQNVEWLGGLEEQRWADAERG